MTSKTRLSVAIGEESFKLGIVTKKSAVIAAILNALKSEFDTYVTTSKKARSTGNDAQTKAEGKYDTRSTEENYLADGLAKHALVAREAHEAIASMPTVSFESDRPISLGALIELDFGSEIGWFFLAPAAGGLEVTVEETIITVLTPESPLGLQLQGRLQGGKTAMPATKILRVI